MCLESIKHAQGNDAIFVHVQLPDGQKHHFFCKLNQRGNFTIKILNYSYIAKIKKTSRGASFVLFT